MIGFISKIFGGSKSEKDVKTILPLVSKINQHFAEYNTISNDELRGKTVEDGHGRLAIQLLVYDGFRQAVELGRPKLHPTWPDALDNGAHDGVGFLEVGDSFPHGYSCTTSRRSKANKKRIVKPRLTLG